METKSENKEAFENRIKYIKEARFFKSITFENIISDLSDIDFLRLNLGIYTDVYINEIENNFEKISSEIKSELEKSEYSKLDIEAIKILETKAKDLVLKNKIQSKSGNKQQSKQLKDFLINANKFNDKEVEKIESSLIKHFQKPIIKAYSKNKKFSKQPFNFMILKLQNNYIDTTKHNNTDVVKYFKKLFFGAEWKQNIDKDIRAYNKSKKEFEAKKELSKEAKSIYNNVIELNFEAFKNDMMFLNAKFKNDSY